MVITEFKVRFSSDIPMASTDNAVRDLQKIIQKYVCDQSALIRSVDVEFVKDSPMSSPKWPMHITDEQKSALWRKWRQENQDLTFQEFVDGIQPGTDGCVMVQWCNMWLGIEKDGYTHS